MDLEERMLYMPNKSQMSLKVHINEKQSQVR